VSDKVTALTNRLNEMESLLKRVTASTTQQADSPNEIMLLDESSVLRFGSQSRSQPALPQLRQLLSDPATSSFETLLSSRSRKRPGGFGEYELKEIAISFLELTI
jgi:hypothetical protein